MKIFVTGASGFIGSALCSQLAAAESPADITCLVRDEGRATALEARGFRVVRADLLEPDRYRAALAEAECVYHLGATATFGNRLDYERDNVESTRRLIDAARAAPALRDFIFTSSIGAVDRTPGDPCDAPLTARSTPCPQSAYGRSKLRGEELLRASGLPWTIVRPAWVYGPGMRADSHIAAFIRAVLDGRRLTRFDFPGRVSVIHVEDLARALLHLRNGGSRGRVLFAAHPESHAIGGIFARIAELAGKAEAPSVRFPAWFSAAGRRLRRYLPFMAQNLFSDVLTCTGADLRDAGCAPQKDFTDGLRETIAYFSAFRNGRFLVTGAAGGIGEAVARELAARGRRLYLVDRDEQGLRRVAGDLGAEALAADLSEPDACERLKRWTDAGGEPVCGLVNNAGLGYRRATADQTVADIARTIDVNVRAVMLLTRLYLPAMRAHGYGRILNIASSTAFFPLPGMSVYGASKAAVVSFSEALWAELRGSGVGVTCVCPSGTQTGFQARAGVKVLQEGRGLAEPAGVAKRAVTALESGRLTVVLGFRSIVLIAALRALPAKARALLCRLLMEQMR